MNSEDEQFNRFILKTANEQGLKVGVVELGEPVRLNLGCGEILLDGYINVDMYQKHPNILNVDLNKLPLPFDTGSADEILISHIVEHLDQPYEFIMDCTRILKKNGKLVVRLPSYCNILQHRRSTHTTSYLNVLFKEDEQGRQYRMCAYELEKFCMKRSYIRENGFKNFIFKRVKYRIGEWFYALLYGEYEWVLRKK